MGDAHKTIVLLPGDGIGPEVTAAAARVLRDCAAEFGHQFELSEFPIGGAAIDSCGTPLPAETLEACRRADAVLLGAVGGPRWDGLPLGQRPESGLLNLRRGLDLYINVRPIRLCDPLRGSSPLKLERARTFDFEIVRELAGGIYFGAHRFQGANGAESASDTETYTTEEIERVARFAFARADCRSGRLASVDKANVLASSSLWRKTVSRLATDYPRVALEHLSVDNAAMQLILRPEQFDVLVTSNMFGDILSDEAAALVGSIGLVPSMCLGGSTPLYEPIHGSAPALAGQDRANPLGAILCTSLLLRESFGLNTEAEWIENAVERVLARGYRTEDIAEPRCQTISGSAALNLIREEMSDSLAYAERYGWGV